uniref:Uncharacterized protein n=1 Tax=Glossina austeni TaxID=7395 RepID=A0A1A9V0V0_GLOAU
MNHINCAITKCRSVTPKILPAITELIPTGVNHITHVTIFMTTSNIAAKKSTTTCPLEPIVPRNVPNTKQKNTIPNVLVPLRYCMTRIRAGSVTSSRCAPVPCSMLSSNSVSSTFSFTVSLNACRTAGLGTTPLIQILMPSTCNKNALVVFLLVLETKPTKGISVAHTAPFTLYTYLNPVSLVTTPKFDLTAKKL